MRIVFCGTPEFSVEPLKQLVENQHNVVAVYTQPDRGVGRGRKIQFSAVKEYAQQQNIDVFQPSSLRNEDAIKQLKELKPDLLIVVAYGLILPQEALDIPTISCWNIHASLLPKWRGAAPIHRALLAGDETTGVGIMQMEAGLDTGPVYIQHECKISNTEVIQNLHDKLKIMGAHALLECIGLLEKKLLPEPMIQDASNKTYAKKLEKSESLISWDESARQIERKIRAFNPWPGVAAKIQGISYKLWQSEVVSLSNQEITKVKTGGIVKANKNELIIQCHESHLKINIIQKPGKKQMPISQFMQSKPDWFT